MADSPEYLRKRLEITERALGELASLFEESHPRRKPEVDQIRKRASERLEILNMETGPVRPSI